MIIAETAARIRANVQKVIVGKGDVIDLALVAVLCEGHILIEDVPGIGKTTLAKALAASLGLNFRRIQFTPDLLPSDVTGINVFNQKTQDFEFRPGPVFANVVLADEINRATPRTQSAMLEAMQERQVTADGETRLLPRPFLVVATQNPIELEGTFPLPEAQIDRFLVRLPLGYPSVEEEESILLRFQDGNPLDTLRAVASIDELATLSHEARKVRVEASVRRYIVELVNNTRRYSEVYLGASPRGSLGLYRTAQARAALNGRDYVLPDDVKHLAVVVLAHRLLLEPAARLKGVAPSAVIQEILNAVPIPGGDVRRPA